MSGPVDTLRGLAVGDRAFDHPGVQHRGCRFSVWTGGSPTGNEQETEVEGCSLRLRSPLESLGEGLTPGVSARNARVLRRTGR